MFKNFLDEYFNYIQLSNGIKKEIWKPTFKNFNKRVKINKTPFRYISLGIVMYFVCLFGSLIYIKENIIIGRKQHTENKTSIFKSIMELLGEPHFNWVDAIFGIVLLTLVVDNIMLVYGPNQDNINGMQHTKSHIEAQCPVQLEQREIPAVNMLNYYADKKTRYTV